MEQEQDKAQKPKKAKQAADIDAAIGYTDINSLQLELEIQKARITNLEKEIAEIHQKLKL